MPLARRVSSKYMLEFSIRPRILKLAVTLPTASCVILIWGAVKYLSTALLVLRIRELGLHFVLYNIYL